MPTKITIDEMATFCKKKGFVYPNSEVYGGMAGFWDYGPLGVELKNNIRDSWWSKFVQSRDDVVGIDGTTISNPMVWKASGHVDNFSDVYVKCTSCKKPNKVDKNELEKAKCECGGEYQIIGDVNLMFKTNVGPVEGNVAYLRPETAQLIFTNFKLVHDTSRVKLPFGVAQVGRAFRNEISPRDFLFRCREFEQMEIEFFIHPEQKDCSLLDDDEHMKFELQLLSEEDQKKGKKEGKKIKLKDMLNKKMLGAWHAYWLKETYQWFLDMGVDRENLRLREHMKDELAHYSSACFDVEYKFSFGWKEIHGNANRGQFDLNQHQKQSKKSMEIFDEETRKKVIPRVIEPSQGLDRAFLAVLFNAYNDDKKRGNVVLKLEPKLSPVKAGVFPLVNKLAKEARQVYNHLKKKFVCQFDTSGSVGRRYARADEIGVPYCITVDFDTLKDKAVTIRDRDSTKQVRVKIDHLKDTLNKLINSDIEFEKAGKLI
ncbi:glycine--tRNA ligase [Candidatus Woesearchaeota archaeon]|nr:glycine--tRNA ligase [Candidatus Woesearchaeota archaeon]